MKSIKHICLFIALVSSVLISNAQSFKKGSFLLSISEGSTRANYSTSTNFTHSMVNSDMDGVRDPLFIEYGISNKWGIGLSTGNDLFNVDSKKFYGFNTENNKPLSVKTSEFTFDLNYHLFSSKRTDFSLYGSIGSFGVSYSEKVGNANYTYQSKGGIVRVGGKLRYYFWKRLGVMAMYSLYSANSSPVIRPTISEAPNYSTQIKGSAFEFGLCFRFF